MKDLTPPKVRFAPSPTGGLHLGGARTALFNYLFSKQARGQFFLRIEDTDKERSHDVYTQQICESLDWLGLHPDGEIVYQSQRTKVYHNVISQLLSSGHAYRCFCTKDIIEKSRAQGVYIYPQTCRDLDERTIAMHLNSGEDFVIRLKVPKGKTTFQDMIYGAVTTQHNEIGDFILARSDGYPTYNLVVAVDDHDMHISHVIRGADHISNTPKQILIYNALDFDIPQFAHLPLILGPDKKRLSKRHGAPGVQSFRNEGYLPEALLNYLVLLGWNPDTDVELFTLAKMVAKFNITQVNKSGAVYDEKKLNWISSQHIQRLGNKKILDGILDVAPDWGQGFDTKYKYTVLDLFKMRAKSSIEFIAQSTYFFNDPMDYDSAAVANNWPNSTMNEHMLMFANRLQKLGVWTAVEIESELRTLADQLDISAATLVHPARLAISGVSKGPSLFAIMELLGKEVCYSRLRRALEQLPK